MKARSSFQQWQSQIVLGAGDATKVLKAAPGAGKRLVVTKLWANVLVSAAQPVDIEGSDGTDELIKFAASAAVGTQASREFDEGWALAQNIGLRIQPGAAGPSVHVVAEGYIRG